MLLSFVVLLAAVCVSENLMAKHTLNYHTCKNIKYLHANISNAMSPICEYVKNILKIILN